jgi:pilus assembly protein CpaD
MKRTFLPRLASAALLSVAFALGACGPANRGLDSVHQPVVSRTDYVLDLSTGEEALAYGEANRLAAWFDTLELSYGDRIFLDGAGVGGARDDVASVAARYGLLLSEGAPVTEGAVEPGRLRVVVSRAEARVEGCPDWRRKSQPELGGSTMSNYGCATNSNLAAMVANPEDLVRGQAQSGSDARAVTKAITTYRELPSTAREGLEDQTTQGAK